MKEIQVKHALPSKIRNKLFASIVLEGNTKWIHSEFNSFKNIKFGEYDVLR